MVSYGREGLVPLSGLREAYLHLTNRCQVGCKHCYARATPKGWGDELTTEEWVAAVDRLVELGVERFVFIGGDPFERGDLFELMAYVTQAKSKRLRVFYNCHIGAELARKLKGVANGHLSLQLSLDGPTPAIHDAIRRNGNFEVSLEGVAHLQAVGLNPMVNTVVTSLSVEYLTDMAALLSDLGIRRLHLLFPHHVGYIRHRPSLIPSGEQLAKNLRRLARQAAEVGLFVDNFAAWRARLSGRFDLCNAGFDLLALGPDGQVYPCPVTVGDPAFSGGSIREEGVEEIWRESAAFRWVRGATVREKEGCAACPIRDRCGGECMVQAYYQREAETGRGDLAASFPYCGAVRAVFSDLIEGTDARPPSPDGPVRCIPCT